MHGVQMQAANSCMTVKEGIVIVSCRFLAYGSVAGAVPVKVERPLCVEGTRHEIPHPGSDSVMWSEEEAFRARSNPDEALFAALIAEEMAPRLGLGSARAR